MRAGKPLVFSRLGGFPEHELKNPGKNSSMENKKSPDVTPFKLESGRLAYVSPVVEWPQNIAELLA